VKRIGRRFRRRRRCSGGGTVGEWRREEEWRGV
jgi:hypothetical protein